MKIGFHAICCTALLLIVTQNSHARNMMCWENKQKIRECGETVPPEYAQQRIEVLNERGMVVEVIEPRKTEAQLAQEAHEAKKQQALEERRRQDQILLQTFTTENDLLDSQNKKLSTIDSTITIVSGNLRYLGKNLEALQKQAANHERSGRAIPPQLIKDIASIKQQIAEKETYLAEREKVRGEMVAKFAANLQRYRRLKKVKPY